MSIIEMRRRRRRECPGDESGKAAWMADNGMPNSKEASMTKAKAGRVGNEVTLRCVELCAAAGYGQNEVLEK
jgi:acyl-CoA dehydrogenase